jgi:uncharacterized protein (TIGR02246 family)
MARAPKSSVLIQDLHQRLSRMEDDCAIRNLAARFSDCANERDFDGFAELWSAHGVWEIGQPFLARAKGVDAIVEMLRRLLESRTMFMQMTHSGVVTLIGDRATARFVERERAKGENSFYENLAVYNDEVVREADGVWRFSRRHYVYRYLDETSFPGRVFPLTSAVELSSDLARDPGGASQGRSR